MDRAIKLCQQYGFNVIDMHVPCLPLGIGDLLFLLLAIRESLINTPVSLNMNILINSQQNMYFANPISSLEFRLQLLQMLMKKNNISQSDIVFNICSNPPPHPLSNINYFDYTRLNNIHLEFDKKLVDIPKPYIVFHTKIRMDHSYDYAALMSTISVFCDSFCTNYTIVLLGEKNMPNTIEAKHHNMISCYNELSKLKKNNTVIDLATETFDIPDINQYTHDISIISEADTNILFGGGGAACSSLVFGKALIHFCIEYLTNYPFNKISLRRNHSELYADCNQQINYIWARYGNRQPK
jgi:hypothetical protein